MLKLLVQKGNSQGLVIEINEFPAIFGRGEDCTHKLGEGGISRKHFAIERHDNVPVIRDMDSKNGTYLNDELVVGVVPLSNGDIIVAASEVTLEVLIPKKKNENLLNPQKTDIPLINHKQSATVEKKAVDSEMPMVKHREDSIGSFSNKPKTEPITDSGSFVRRKIDISETMILGPTQEKLYHSYRALKSIYEVVQKCNSEPDHDALFECLLSSLFKAIRADRGAVVLRRPTDKCKDRLFMVKGKICEQFTISTTIMKDVIENGVSVISLNPEEDARYRFSESLRLQKVASLICAPLISYEKVFGAVYLDRGQTQIKPFTEEELELLAAIGIQMGNTLENSLLLRELEASVEEQEHLLEALKESEERYALAAGGANDGLWDWNLKTGEIYFSLRWKSMLGIEDDKPRNDPSEWFERIHSDDQKRVKMEIDAHVKGLTKHFESEHRMLHEDGSSRWVLTRGLAVRSSNGKAVRMAGSQTDITERKLAEEQLLHDAFHDALTDLPNRALFIDRLSHTLLRCKREQDYLFGLLHMGLDRFKIINDSLGHMAGDRLLALLARRLQVCLRPGDTLARFAGDEFSILFDEISDIREITRVAEKIRQELSLPFSLDKQEIFITASMGIIQGNAKYSRAEDVVRDGTAAMYRAKEVGKGRYEVFDKGSHAKAVELLQLEMDLHHAVERKEFLIYYQPIVMLDTGKIAGFEALVRWNHPDRGIVSPVDFIPLAEETGLILPLGAWVLENACQQICEWHRAFPKRDHLSISVNLSSKQVMHQELIEQIKDILKKTSIEPRCLKLEITETTIMENSELVIDILNRLKAMEVHLMIDDFGTGYSSLSYLHRFPFNTLKIDRSFIMSMEERENSEIIRTIVTLGRNLNMSTVAEGIETEDNLKQLKTLNCEYGQGYFFSKPLDTESAESLIAENKIW